MRHRPHRPTSIKQCLPNRWLATLLLLLTLLGCTAPTDTLHGPATVIDGDSLTIGTTEVRLWGIDAVELDQTCDRTWPCGFAAKQALKAFIGTEPLTCHVRDSDRYKRQVTECFKDDMNVNAWLVRHGWALAYRQYSEKFIPEERKARAQQIGVWRGSFVKPWDWRRHP